MYLSINRHTHICYIYACIFSFNMTENKNHDWMYICVNMHTHTHRYTRIIFSLEGSDSAVMIQLFKYCVFADRISHQNCVFQGISLNVGICEPQLRYSRDWKNWYKWIILNNFQLLSYSWIKAARFKVRMVAARLK